MTSTHFQVGRITTEEGPPSAMLGNLHRTSAGSDSQRHSEQGVRRPGFPGESNAISVIILGPLGWWDGQKNYLEEQTVLCKNKNFPCSLRAYPCVVRDKEEPSTGGGGCGAGRKEHGFCILPVLHSKSPSPPFLPILGQ